MGGQCSPLDHPIILTRASAGSQGSVAYQHIRSGSMGLGRLCWEAGVSGDTCSPEDAWGNMGSSFHCTGRPGMEAGFRKLSLVPPAHLPSISLTPSS